MASCVAAQLLLFSIETSNLCPPPPPRAGFQAYLVRPACSAASSWDRCGISLTFPDKSLFFFFFFFGGGNSKNVLCCRFSFQNQDRCPSVPLIATVGGGVEEHCVLSLSQGKRRRGHCEDTPIFISTRANRLRKRLYGFWFSCRLSPPEPREE